MKNILSPILLALFMLALAAFSNYLPSLINSFNLDAPSKVVASKQGVIQDALSGTDGLRQIIADLVRFLVDGKWRVDPGQLQARQAIMVGQAEVGQNLKGDIGALSDFLEKNSLFSTSSAPQK